MRVTFLLLLLPMSLLLLSPLRCRGDDILDSLLAFTPASDGPLLWLHVAKTGSSFARVLAVWACPALDWGDPRWSAYLSDLGCALHLSAARAGRGRAGRRSTKG